VARPASVQSLLGTASLDLLTSSEPPIAHLRHPQFAVAPKRFFHCPQQSVTGEPGSPSKVSNGINHRCSSTFPAASMPAPW